jgi:hypothetical protein
VSARSVLTDFVSTRRSKEIAWNLCMQGVHMHPQGVRDSLRLEISRGVEQL